MAFQRGGALRPEPPPINADRPGGNRGGSNTNLIGNFNTTEINPSLTDVQAEHVRRHCRLAAHLGRAVAELAWRAA